MIKNDQLFSRLLRSPRGFTVTELLVVIALIAILSAMAIPSFVSWRQNIEFREAAREIGTALRVARSYAISDNRQYGVEIDPNNRRFRFKRGNTATNSTIWENITRPGPQAVASNTIWTAFSPRVRVNNNTLEIRFSPNGIATFNNPVIPTAIAAPTSIPAGTGAFIIQDDVGTDRFGVIVTPTGRIQIRQPPF